MTPRRSKSLAPVEGEREVRAALQALAESEGLRQLAIRAKLNASMVSRAIRGQAPISTKLAKAAGFEKVIVFRPTVR